jgi:hypothetical protein
MWPEAASRPVSATMTAIDLGRRNRLFFQKTASTGRKKFIVDLHDIPNERTSSAQTLNRGSSMLEWCHE